MFCCAGKPLTEDDAGVATPATKSSLAPYASPAKPQLLTKPATTFKSPAVSPDKDPALEEREVRLEAAAVMVGPACTPGLMQKFDAAGGASDALSPEELVKATIHFDFASKKHDADTFRVSKDDRCRVAPIAPAPRTAMEEQALAVVMAEKLQAAKANSLVIKSLQLEAMLKASQSMEETEAIEQLKARHAAETAMWSTELNEAAFPYTSPGAVLAAAAPKPKAAQDQNTVPFPCKMVRLADEAAGGDDPAAPCEPDLVTTALDPAALREDTQAAVFPHTEATKGLGVYWPTEHSADQLSDDCHPLESALVAQDPPAPLSDDELTFAETFNLNLCQGRADCVFDCGLPENQPAAWATELDEATHVIVNDTCTAAQIELLKARAAKGPLLLAAQQKRMAALLQTGKIGKPIKCQLHRSPFTGVPAAFLAELLAPEEDDAEGFKGEWTLKHTAALDALSDKGSAFVEYATDGKFGGFSFDGHVPPPHVRLSRPELCTLRKGAQAKTQ